MSGGRKSYDSSRVYKESEAPKQGVNIRGGPSKAGCPSSIGGKDVNRNVNFKKSGKLDRNFDPTSGGTRLQYCEPQDARSTSEVWVLFVFDGDNEVDTIRLNFKSAYLLGTDASTVDVALLHKSCASQHAVIQFRETGGGSVGDSVDEVGLLRPVPKSHATVKPYVIDLQTRKGTFLNDVKLPSNRFVELRSRDVLSFGSCPLDYVLVKE